MLKLRRSSGSLRSVHRIKESIPRSAQVPAAPEPPADDFWAIDEAELLTPPPGNSYELALSAFFQARHFVTIAGLAGPIHEHAYRLQVRCCCQTLHRSDNTTISYCTLREIVHGVAQRYDSQLLNDLPPFRRLQPTTEVFVGVLFQQLRRLLQPFAITIKNLELWESPTVSVAYHAAAGYTLSLNN